MGVEETKSALPPGNYYFSGADAAAEGAIAAGCRYYGGYPITPSSEIMERIAARFPEVGGVFMQMEDEIGSICSMIGASWAGAKAMTATSGPGFSLMQEGIGYSAWTETPIVIMDVQRAGPATGQASRVGGADIMQAKWGSQGDYQVIALSPWSVQEMYDQAINAFNLAEKYRVPVIMLSEEAIAHLYERMEIKEKVTVFHRRKEKGAAPFGGVGEDGVPPMPAFGEGEKLLVTGSTHDDWGIRRSDNALTHSQQVTRINRKILNKRDEIIDYETYYLEDARIAVVANGFTARSALYAVEQLRQEGKKVGMIRLKTIWPFADKLFRELDAKVEKIFVPEMNSGQIAGEIMKYACGKVVTYSQINGEIIHPQVIMEEVRRLF